MTPAAPNPEPLAPMESLPGWRRRGRERAARAFRRAFARAFAAGLLAFGAAAVLSTALAAFAAAL